MIRRIRFLAATEKPEVAALRRLPDDQRPVRLVVATPVELAYQRWGRLDVLFNNAGIAEARRLLELTPEEWDRMLAVNLRAVFFVLQAAAKRMRQQTPIAGSELRGKLIQTASIASYRGGAPTS